MKIIRKRLYESEGLSAIVRWDETCECVQSLFGDTWVDNPTADPRYNPANLAPANSESDPRCSAALGMRTKIENIMNLFFLADALIDAANSILALITVTLPGVGLIWRVIFAVCEALYAIGSAALVAAFTEEAYDELQCIFYNNIGEDGQMSAEQLSDINTQICEDMDLTICAAMGLMLNMLGFVGMSNAGAMFGEDGDCTSCGEWCYEFDFTLSSGGWTILDVPTTYEYGTYSSGVGYEATFGSPNGNWQLITIWISFASTTITFVEMEYEHTGGAGFKDALLSATLDIVPYLAQESPPSPPLIGWTGSAAMTTLVARIWASETPAAATGIIQKIRVHGVGVNPFGEDNCTP